MINLNLKSVYLTTKQIQTWNNVIKYMTFISGDPHKSADRTPGVRAIHGYYNAWTGFPHKGQYCGALIFSLLTWMSFWLNRWSDLRRLVTHMTSLYCLFSWAGDAGRRVGEQKRGSLAQLRKRHRLLHRTWWRHTLRSRRRRHERWSGVKSEMDHWWMHYIQFAQEISDMIPWLPFSIICPLSGQADLTSFQRTTVNSLI